MAYSLRSSRSAAHTAATAFVVHPNPGRYGLRLRPGRAPNQTATPAARAPGPAAPAARVRASQRPSSSSRNPVRNSRSVRAPNQTASRAAPTATSRAATSSRLPNPVRNPVDSVRAPNQTAPALTATSQATTAGSNFQLGSVIRADGTRRSYRNAPATAQRTRVIHSRRARGDDPARREPPVTVSERRPRRRAGAGAAVGSGVTPNPAAAPVQVPAQSGPTHASSDALASAAVSVSGAAQADAEPASRPSASTGEDQRTPDGPADDESGNDTPYPYSDGDESVKDDADGPGESGSDSSSSESEPEDPPPPTDQQARQARRVRWADDEEDGLLLRMKVFDWPLYDETEDGSYRWVPRLSHEGQKSQKYDDNKAVGLGKKMFVVAKSKFGLDKMYIRRWRAVRDYVRAWKTDQVLYGNSTFALPLYQDETLPVKFNNLRVVGPQSVPDLTKLTWQPRYPGAVTSANELKQQAGDWAKDGKLWEDRLAELDERAKRSSKSKRWVKLWGPFWDEFAAQMRARLGAPRASLPPRRASSVQMRARLDAPRASLHPRRASSVPPPSRPRPTPSTDAIDVDESLDDPDTYEDGDLDDPDSYDDSNPFYDWGF